MKNKAFLLLVLLFAAKGTFAQKPQTPTPSEIYFKMEQLNVLASALYIAAHPDDENTRLITYLSHHEKAYTNYLSLTRGNGGQNLISNELGTDLGVIRTNELWNARSIDGGRQFFSTANDFGFSKHPKEAFEKWDKELLLKQVVYMIRKEQPDVIINRFDHRTEGTTHGHHTASAQLSKLAFGLANSASYKALAKEPAAPWQPKRLFFNVSWFFFGSKKAFDAADKSKYIPLNIGTFYTQLGKNNQEIASLSRSQHQSQGFGDISSRGEEIDYVELVDGAAINTSNLFEGVDTSWNRINGGKAIQPLVTKLIDEYDFKNPSASLDLLVQIYSKVKELPEGIWKNRKLNELKELIKDCSGLYLDLTTDAAFTSPGTEIQIKLEIANRSTHPVILKDVKVHNRKTLISKKLSDQEVFYEYYPVTFDEKDLTNFRFLNDFEDFKSQFSSDAANEIGIEINGVYISYPASLQYHYKDVVKGEIYQAFQVIPEVSVKFSQATYISSSNQQPRTTLLLDNYTSQKQTGILSVFDNRQTKVFSREVTLDENEKNTAVSIAEKLGNGIYTAHFRNSKTDFSNEIKWIDYPHIPINYYLRSTGTKIVSFDKKMLKKHLIGYIAGAGDEIPQTLRDLGYDVRFINMETAVLSDLEKFETIIVGIRAFNTEKSLATKNHVLFDYVKNGGVVITQYQTNTNLQTENIAPYKLKIGKTRITDENAVVGFINPKDTVLNKPFKITQENFKGWVQEQGLYYADEYADEFKPVLTSHDFDEKDTDGALLIAKYGKGYYIYSGLSFFRQLPIGNTGALELFVNLIELKNE